ncbi:hypothetical protein [Flavobacterium ginsenosidimutans]|uniref:Uncharacterized protein n=1 Tax=Flavobacterium ginsenosidimutans TaxID=687844 RepID=A0ABZ2QHH3_9FLAO|nr:hypothetical protein [Flavobacterium ginsenosidimutans]KAF2338808.1 hypothetical protein DM444_00815 [Flavobacterium ginsenosidimutans]
MDIKELKDLEYIKRLSAQYLNILKPADKNYNAEIKVLNYSELGCVITSMLKLCIMALENDTNNKSSIDVGLVLEQALHLFPIDEMELLDVINEVLVKE